jgi:hypothetical protein
VKFARNSDSGENTSRALKLRNLVSPYFFEKNVKYPNLHPVLGEGGEGLEDGPVAGTPTDVPLVLVTGKLSQGMFDFNDPIFMRIVAKK